MTDTPEVNPNELVCPECGGSTFLAENPTGKRYVGCCHCGDDVKPIPRSEWEEENECPLCHLQLWCTTYTVCKRCEIAIRGNKFSNDSSSDIKIPVDRELLVKSIHAHCRHIINLDGEAKDYVTTLIAQLQALLEGKQDA